MLSSLMTLKTMLQADLSDATDHPALTAALRAADAAAKAYCKQNLERQILTQFLDGSGTPEVVISEGPVYAWQQQGHTVAGSPVVTGLGYTHPFSVAMPVSGVAIAPGSTVLSIDSASQITLSANAIKTQTGAVCVGLAVWMDGAGYGGDAINSDGSASAFLTGTQLYLGLDYELRRDQPDGSSKRRILRRIGSGNPGNFSLWSSPWGWGGGFAGGGRAPLSANLPACWVACYQGIKVACTTGYPAGGIPLDLTDAVTQLAAWIHRNLPYGGIPLQSEGYEEYRYSTFSYALSGLNRAPELGSTRQLLNRYRCVSIGGPL